MSIDVGIEEIVVEVAIVNPVVEVGIIENVVEVKTSGAPGKDGIDGQPGADGIDGQPGADGIDGQDGVDYDPAEADLRYVNLTGDTMTSLLTIMYASGPQLRLASGGLSFPFEVTPLGDLHIGKSTVAAPEIPKRIRLNFGSGSVPYGESGVQLQNMWTGQSVVLHAIGSPSDLYITTPDGIGTGIVAARISNPNDGTALRMLSGQYTVSAGRFWLGDTFPTNMGIPQLGVLVQSGANEGLGIVLHPSQSANAFSIRTPGNVERFSVDANGMVKIGTHLIVTGGQVISSTFGNVNWAPTDVTVWASQKVVLQAAGISGPTLKLNQDGTATVTRDPILPLDLATKQYVDSRIWKGTQAAYDAIITKDPNVLYVVKD